jgi:hypothetical protein
MREFIANGGSLIGLVQKHCEILGGIAGEAGILGHIDFAAPVFPCYLTFADFAPPAAAASAAASQRQRETLTDPSLTLQSYTVDPQRERIAMYWKNAERPRFLRSLLADIDGDGACRWR